MENRWNRIYETIMEQKQICEEFREKLQGYQYLLKMHHEAVKELNQLQKKKKSYFFDFFPHRNSKMRLKTEKRLHKIAILKLKVEDLEERVDYYRSLNNEYELQQEKLMKLKEDLEQSSIQILEKNKVDYPLVHENYWTLNKVEEQIKMALNLIKHALWELDGAKDVEEMNLIGGSIAQVVIDDYLLSVETDVQNIQQIVSDFKEGKQCLRLTQNILEQLHMPMNLDQEQKLVEMKDQLSQIEVLLENEISMIWIHQAEEIKKLIEISTKGTNCETTV